MAYIGNTPAESYASFERQVFTIVNSQTAYTLSHAVTNENDIRLVVNNVVQEPGSGKAYTASGTSLTLSAALVNGTDEMYCVYLGRALQTVNPPAASVGNSQTAPTIITGQTAETSIATDDTILIHDTSASALRKMTRANFVSGIGGDNTPAFHIRKSSNQTGLSSGGWTKITFDDEVFDTDNAFASNKFTAPSDGKYFFTAAAKINDTDGNNGLVGSGMRFTINGSIASEVIHFMNANPSYAEGKTLTSVFNLTASQYVEVYAYAQDDGGGSCSITGGNDRDTFFMGFKLIG